jgi:hypothetical protein
LSDSLLAHFFQLFFQRGTSYFETSLVLFGIVKETTSFVKFGLVHGLDLWRLFTPSRLEFVQLIGQFAILRLEKSNLLDVAGETLVEILQEQILVIMLPLKKLYALQTLQAITVF